MKSLQQILKANEQNSNQAYQSGKLKFSKTAGCLVYNPPGVNNFKKENTPKNKKRC